MSKITKKVLKQEKHSEVLLGPNNNVDFLKQFMNITEKLKYKDVTRLNFNQSSSISISH